VTTIRRNHNGYRVGEDHQRAKVPDATVRAMRAAYVPYVFGIQSVAVMFGVPVITARDIVTYRTRPT
jgi:hypothetical protein